MTLPRRFRIGEFVIEAPQGRIRSDAGNCYVEPKAMDVMLCLARHSPETVTKGELLKTVWPDAVVTEHALTRCISQLRRALKDAKARRLIRTIYKRGYRLAAEVSFDSDEEGAGTPQPVTVQETVAPDSALVLSFAQVFSDSSDHVYLYDRQHRYLFANGSGAKALGFEPQDMIGKHWRELDLVPEILEPFEAEVRLAFERGESSVNQVSYPTVFGERCYEYVLDPVHDSKQGIVAVLTIVRDITDRQSR